MYQADIDPGQVMGTPKDAPDPVPLAEAEVLAIAARAPLGVLTVVGVGGLLTSSG